MLKGVEGLLEGMGSEMAKGRLTLAGVVHGLVPLALRVGSPSHRYLPGSLQPRWAPRQDRGNSE